LNLPRPWGFRLTCAAWLLIAQSPNFSTVTLAVASYVVVSEALRGFQQFTLFYNVWNQTLSEISLGWLRRVVVTISVKVEFGDAI
jgi:hypothetical protein